MSINNICIFIILFPLFGSLLVGLFYKKIDITKTCLVTTISVLISFLLSLYVSYIVIKNNISTNIKIFTWIGWENIIPYKFSIGLLIDSLTMVMLLIVSFISFVVHLYSIGYMINDKGYKRFYIYISLFTFMMFFIIISNNFLQLFFGWEGVGLFSYLLISFWYTKKSATTAGLKAFLVNRTSDIGLILGIGIIFSYVHSLDYYTIFNRLHILSSIFLTIFNFKFSLLDIICLLLFIGFMGKSAQIPFHIWLPESMEGPTPVSALIHSATMVTIGIFMSIRISPLLEHATHILSIILIIGSTGAVAMGILALVMYDIKQIIAYSTLSQLGYMMASIGASSYKSSIFHLVIHAFFKALLFLSAGLIIISMNHEQDIRKMGKLWNKIPMSYLSYIIGGLSLCAIPPFSGFYSKSSIIEAVKYSSLPGSRYAYFCLLSAVLITAIYISRSFFLIFHKNVYTERNKNLYSNKYYYIIYISLILLVVPSLIFGYLLYKLFLCGNHFSNSIFISPKHHIFINFIKDKISLFTMIYHSFFTIEFLLTIIGILISFFSYIIIPNIPEFISNKLFFVYSCLVNKYGFDKFVDCMINNIKNLIKFLYKIIDKKIIDSFFIHGIVKIIIFISRTGKIIQNGYIYRYNNVVVYSLFILLYLLLTQF